MVRPLTKAPGRFRELHENDFAKRPARADELHRRMHAGNPWTGAQREAYGDYSGNDGYRRVNGGLRNEEGYRRDRMTDATRQQIADMRAGMREIPDNVVLYRTVGIDAFGFPWQPEMTEERARSLVGRTFHDPGFVSTSVNKRMNKAVQLRIQAPAGTRGAYLADVSRAATEYEMLLDLGTHFKIERFERSPNGDTTLHLTVVGQDEQPV